MVNWQPTTFLRYVRTVQSSSRTALIETDAGAAYFKAINNPEGVHILFCDWFGTILANRFGLPTFDVAVLELTDLDEIPMNGKLSQTGSSFVARAEDGITMGGRVLAKSAKEGFNTDAHRLKTIKEMIKRKKSCFYPIFISVHLC